jgi:hypothetical protein
LTEDQPVASSESKDDGVQVKRSLQREDEQPERGVGRLQHFEDETFEEVGRWVSLTWWWGCY